MAASFLPNTAASEELKKPLSAGGPDCYIPPSNDSNVTAKLWHSKLSSQSLKETKVEHADFLASQSFVENLVCMAFGGTTKHALYANKISEGLQMKVFPPNVVIESLTKLLLGKKLSCYSSAVEILNLCCDSIRCSSRDDVSSSNVCMSISQGTYWLLENTIEVHKLFYTALKDTMSGIEPEMCVKVIAKAQQLLDKLICSRQFEDLNFIGKTILLGEEEYSTLQLQVRDFQSFQLDKIKTNSYYSSFENHLKEFMKIISKYVSTAPKFTQVERLRGHAPSQSLHIYLQAQVLVYLSTKTSKVADILDTWVQLENIPIDHLFTDLFRFISYNILVRKVANEVTFFTAFMFVKLPSVMYHLDAKYKPQSAEKTLYGATYQQFLQLPFDDLDAVLGCDTFKIFINQCQYNKALESKQCDQLMKLRQMSQVEFPHPQSDSIVHKLLAALKKGEDIIKKLNMPIDENKEVSTELQTLLNSADMHLVLTALAADDAISSLILVLLRINSYSERCPDGVKDAQAEMRADLFNNSFLLLAYIDTVFGDKVFLDVPKDYEGKFYLTWQKRCTDITSRKMYNQSVLDSMMEPILSTHLTPTNNAQWDQYCWSIGMIVKELTQAHLRHHIKTDALQKVCENLKNKRPALCVSAVVWLCVQYKTMPQNERNRTIKILMLFKRPLNVAVKAAVLTPILNRYSAPLANVITGNSKTKQAVEENPKSRTSVFASLVRELMPSPHSVLFDQVVMEKMVELNKQIGYQTFTESLLKHVLETGKEEEAKMFCNTFSCLVLLEPVEILSVMFTKVLKSMFFCSRNPKLFSNPHGLYLAQCIGKTFATTMILFETSPTDSPKHAKIARLSVNLPDRDVLVNSFVTFLEDSITLLSTNEVNAVTTFVLNVIEEVGMSSALLKTPINLKQNVVRSILQYLPPTMSRDAITLLCDTTTGEGREAAASFLIYQSNVVST